MKFVAESNRNNVSVYKQKTMFIAKRVSHVFLILKKAILKLENKDKYYDLQLISKECTFQNKILQNITK